MDLKSVQIGQIASASSAQYTQTLLHEMFQDPNIVAQLKVLIVPKDIDALMSLGFGMAKSAITTDYSLETLKKMNSVLYKKISILAESKEARLLILAEPGKNNAEQLLSILQSMAADPKGKEKLRMLGLDDWQTLD